MAGLDPAIHWPQDLTPMAKKKDDGFKIIADNRKARFAYAIDETLEAGVILMG